MNSSWRKPWLLVVNVLNLVAVALCVNEQNQQAAVVSRKTSCAVLSPKNYQRLDCIGLPFSRNNSNLHNMFHEADPLFRIFVAPSVLPPDNGGGKRYCSLPRIPISHAMMGQTSLFFDFVIQSMI
jgi:hypothetical protein